MDPGLWIIHTISAAIEIHIFRFHNMFLFNKYTLNNKWASYAGQLSSMDDVDW